MSKRSWIGIFIALVVLWVAASAHATTYTLNATIHMDDGNGNILDIMQVFDDTGTTTCLSGGCAGSDILIFEVSVVSGTFEEISGSALIAFPQDVGYYDSGTETEPSTGSVVGGIGQFDFDAPVLAGDSVRMFITYAALTGTEAVSFSATPVGFVLFNEAGGIIAPIPEPGTAALLALGLVSFGMGSRKRSSS